MSNLALRVLTALVGIPLVLGLLYLGGWAFAALVLAASLLAQHELYGLMRQGGLAPYDGWGLVLGAAVVLHPAGAWWLPAAAAVLLALFVRDLFSRDERPLANLAATLFGAVYPAALFSFLLALRWSEGASVADREAFYLTLSVFLLIWATDTFAYFAGRSLGRRPLFPRVSPKKTWEGAVGGALGAVLVAAALKGLLLDFLSWADVLVLALACGVFSQLGDLFESRLKRSVGAKDSGTLLPGHGGLLDRFDALLLAAPVVYLYLRYGSGLLQ